MGNTYTTHGILDKNLWEDEDILRYMWYASFLKPLYDHSLKKRDGKKKNRAGRKANRSMVSKLLVDELKRSTREADAVEKIMNGANDFKGLMDRGCDFSAVSILLSDIRVYEDSTGDSITENTQVGKLKSSMNGQQVFTATEND